MPLSLFSDPKTCTVAIKWLLANRNNTHEDFYPLGEEGFYARIMSYQLLPRDQARFEAHKRTIDIQFTVSGSEIIEVAPVDALIPINDYSQDQDVEHFNTPPVSHAFVTNAPGFFTVLFPNDAHMPKLLTPTADFVTKIVIKIPIGTT